MDTGWDFDAFYKQDDSSFKTSVSCHEALVFRASEYEKKAMMKEILRRLRPTVTKKKVEKNKPGETKTDAPSTGTCSAPPPPPTFN